MEVEVLVAQLCPTLCDPMNCSPLAPLLMGFSRHKYWNGSPFPSPGDLPDPEIEPWSPALQADSLPSEPPAKPIYSSVYMLIPSSQFIYSPPTIRAILENDL